MLSCKLKIKQIAVFHTDTKIIFSILPKQKRSSCPLCNKYGNRIHSHYVRSLADLPISGKLVQLQLRARKFFCRNKSCPRKIFTERFSQDILPYARRLCRSIDVLRSIGLEVGGNKGALISRIAGNPVSSSTILRLIQQLEIEGTTTTSGVIGVDDWAFKKGRNYGTIIVDLERKKVVDLLPDREADTLKQWLLKHPEIHTVSRDRASAYSKGTKEGTKEAIEVADRYHLHVNLRDAFKRVLHKHSTTLKAAFIAFSRPGNREPLLEEEKARSLPTPKCTSNSQRQMKFEKAKELHQQGYRIKTIAKMLQAGPRTIGKYIQHDEFPKRQAPVPQATMTNFHEFREYLPKFYGKQDYPTLYKNIRDKGFNGKYTQFCSNMNQFIKPDSDNIFLPKLSPIKTWSTSKISFMVLQPEDRLKKTDQAFLKFLYNKAPEIKAAVEMAVQFKSLFKNKEEGPLESWLTRALQPESELRSFAQGVKHDYSAINQAVISVISNGQVEGQVNKLKNIKRMMYGRANFPLLKKMVLHESMVHQK